MNRLVGVVLLLIVYLCNMSAQRYSEEEIQLQDLYIQANQKKLLNKYEEAIEIYERILTKDPLNAAVLNDMARVYLAQDKLKEAINSAKKAVQFAPENIWYLFTLNEAYGSSEAYADQAQVLISILAIKEDQDLYMRLADTWINANELTKAIAVYQEAMEKYGWTEYLVDSSIDTYLKNTDPNGAEKLIKEYIKKKPDDLSRLQKLGEFYLFTNRESKAKKVFEEVIEKEPGHPGASYQLSLLQNAERRNKDQDQLSFIINDSRLGAEDKIKAVIPVLQQHINANEDDQQRGATLLTYAQNIVAQYPDEAKAYALLGDVLYANGNIEKAIDQYQKSIDLDKSTYDVWRQMMICLHIISDYDRLKGFSAKAMDFYPNQSGPYLYQAKALFQLGRVQEAKDYADEALFISGSRSADYIDIVILQSRIDMSDGDLQVAIDRLQKLHSDDKGNSISYEYLGDLLKEKGDKAEAEKCWKTALDKGGDINRIKLKLQSI